MIPFCLFILLTMRRAFEDKFVCCPSCPGVLSGGAEEFETVDDVYEAVGDILTEMDGDSSDAEAVQRLCQLLLSVVKR